MITSKWVKISSKLRKVLRIWGRKSFESFMSGTTRSWYLRENPPCLKTSSYWRNCIKSCYKLGKTTTLMATSSQLGSKSSVCSLRSSIDRSPQVCLKTWVCTLKSRKTLKTLTFWLKTTSLSKKSNYFDFSLNIFDEKLMHWGGKIDKNLSFIGLSTKGRMGIIWSRISMTLLQLRMILMKIS